jgi:hypothetical protein
VSEPLLTPLSAPFPVVDAKDALGGYPPFVFQLDEFPDPLFPYEFQVPDFAHAVPGAVTVIQVPEPVAGKFGAVAAKPSLAFSAGPQPAIYSCLGLVLLRVEATVAGVVGPQMGPADAAIHAARRDELDGETGFGG